MSCVYLKEERKIKEMVDKEMLKNTIFASKDISLIKGGQLDNKFFFSRGWGHSESSQYAYYPTVHHFLKYLRSLPEHQRTLFEVVRSEAPCKVHFDLENIKYISDERKAFDVITTLCNDFSKYIQMISDFDIEFEDYRITCSSGLKTQDKKQFLINSYHVVLHGVFILQNNHQYMKQLVTDFLSYYEKKKPIWFKWVDTSIYKHNGIMRCIYCKKPFADGRFFTKIGDYPDEDYFITNVNTELESLDIPLEQNVINSNGTGKGNCQVSKVFDKVPKDLAKTVTKLINQLPPIYVTERDNWCKVAWTLHSIHPGLYSVFEKWSKTTDKNNFDKKSCMQIWSKSYNGYDGFPTLYSMLAEAHVRLKPHLKEYNTDYFEGYSYFPQHPLENAIRNKYYASDVIINETDKFLKPEDFTLPESDDTKAKYNLFVKAGAGKGKSDRVVALCTSLVEQGKINNGTHVITPNKSLCDSLFWRFSGKRLIKTTVNDEEIFVARDDPDWVPPHGYTGDVSSKDLGFIHYGDEQYKKCLAPENGDPLNVAIVINSITRIMPSYVARQLQLHRQTLEALGKSDAVIEESLSTLEIALDKDYSQIVPDCIVLDEAFSFLLNLSSGTMCKTRIEIMNVLTILIKHCKYLILMDAHINDSVLEIIKNLRPQETYTKFIWYKQPSCTDMNVYEMEKKQLLWTLASKLKQGKKVFICSNLKKNGV